MTASMYIPLVLALIFVNAPFVTTKFFGAFLLKRKYFGHHLAELVIGFILAAVLIYVLEPYAGVVQYQDWELHTTVVHLYLIFAFFCFMWRYFWHARDRE